MYKLGIMMFNYLQYLAPLHLASRRFHIVETSLICHLTAPSRTMPAIQNLLLMGFLCSWSIGLKFPSGQLVRSGYWLEQFLAISEDVSIYDTLMHPAQWKFHDDVLYKSTFSSLCQSVLRDVWWPNSFPYQSLQLSPDHSR